MHKIVTLKQRRDAPLRAGHPWVFSNAIAREPTAKMGDLVNVVSNDGATLGTGLYHHSKSIRVRMLSKNEVPELSSFYIAACIKELKASKQKHLPPLTNAVRIVHADADALPGLILDNFSDVFVFQIHTAAMDRYRADIINAIKSAFEPRAIIERSDVSAREKEGMQELPPAVHFGNIDRPIIFEENGIKYLVDVLQGQKTGFYLDQREARLKIGSYAKGRRVLNLFSYTGATGLCASLAGAAHVIHVDASKLALEYAHEIYRLNYLDPENETLTSFIRADAFEYIAAQSEAEGLNLIICDPPAFAKSGKDSAQALKAYTSLNRKCFERLEGGGILVTSSCSGMISQDDFRSALKIAAGQAGRDAIVLDSFGQPFDHTQKLSFPEGAYLKTMVLEVR